MNRSRKSWQDFTWNFVQSEGKKTENHKNSKFYHESEGKKKNILNRKKLCKWQTQNSTTASLNVEMYT